MEAGMGVSALRGQAHEPALSRVRQTQGWVESSELSLEAKATGTWWFPLFFSSHFSAQLW